MEADDAVDFQASDIDPHPAYSRFDPVLIEELSRSVVAVLLLVIFLFTVVAAFTNVGGKSWANTKELLDLLVPAETAVLGIAVGFYFALTK